MNFAQITSPDFAPKKDLQNLNAVRTKFLAITDRFARLQAQWLNVHVDFPLLQRMALPIVTGSVYYAGIKSMRPASSGSWRLFCMPATISAAGAPSTFIKSFSRASNFPKKPTSQPTSLRPAQTQGPRPDRT